MKSNEVDIKLMPYIKGNINKKKLKNNVYALDMVNAKSFWPLSNQGEGIKIAVIDSGCDVNHNSLKDNIIDVKNFTNEDNKKSDVVTDRVGHGTHVIGSIASNSKVLGIAPKSEILVLKALDETGSGKVSWVVNAINYAVSQKVDIISMSLGIGVDDEKLSKAVKNAIANNILVVCAAGNEGDGNYEDFEYSYPAAYVDVISVGAVDKKGKPAEFSNANLVVDLVAPGVDIISTYPDDQFVSLSGTSMATPYVSGALALIKNWSKEEFQRELTQEELYAQLIKYTKSINYPRTIQGNGILNLKK